MNFKNTSTKLNTFAALILVLIFSGCNLSTQPGIQPTVVSTALPTATLPSSTAVSANATQPEVPTIAVTKGDFGPITEPNFTPPPTFTQAPFITPTVSAPTAGSTNITASGTISGFGSVTESNSNSQPTNPTFLPTAVIQTAPTIQPTQPSLINTADPNATSQFGAVIGPDYTPPPSLTPVIPTPVDPVNVTLPPAVTAGPSPTPGPVLRRDLMGIQVHPFLTTEQWDKMLDHVRNLGLGWVKVQVGWKDMEPSKGQFSEQYRTLVLHLQRAGSPKIKVMVSIAKAPDWARPAGVRGQEDGPPDNPQDLSDFITHLVHDTSAGNIDAIEVWNEPNLIREWRGKAIGGAEYMKLFNAAYTAVINEQKMQVNQFRPNHRIIMLTSAPAPTSTAADGSSMDDRAWMQQLYANGLGNYGDDVAVAAHPYAWANPPDAVCCNASPGVTGWYEHPVFYLRNNLDAYRQIMTRNNDSRRKIWITEFGYASYDGLRRSDGNAASVNPASAWEGFLNQQQQASYVLRAFYLLQQPPYYEYLGPVMLWNLNFAFIPKMTDDGREEAGFSLLDQNGSPRPVYSALQSAPKE